MFAARGVGLYVNGHDHSLQHIRRRAGEFSPYVIDYPSRFRDEPLLLERDRGLHVERKECLAVRTHHLLAGSRPSLDDVGSAAGHANDRANLLRPLRSLRVVLIAFRWI